MPTITGIHHASFTVQDAARSERFYADVLGFNRVFELPDEDGRGAKLVMIHPDTFTVIGFTVHASNEGSEFSEFRTGLDHLAFGVPSREALDEWTARLDELGIEHGEIVSTPVGHLLAFRDPDGIALELWSNP